MKNAVEKFTELSAVSVLAIVLMVGLGSAALLTTFGTVEDTANVQQAIELEDNKFTLNDFTAGESEVMLAEIRNNANVNSSAEFSLWVEDSSGDIVEDGVYLAFTDDINYYFDNGIYQASESNYGDDGVWEEEDINTWSDWAEDYHYWNDWWLGHGAQYYEELQLGDQAYDEYDEDDIKFEVENAAFMDENGVISDVNDFPADTTFYALVHVGTHTGAQPDDYTVNLELEPVE